MRFPIGSYVRLVGYTGDDQIDALYGHVLEVVSFENISTRITGLAYPLPNYTLVSTDNYHMITANEHELEAA